MTAVDDFLSWARDDRNRSPLTIDRYRAVLAAIPGDPLTADRDTIEAWWAGRYGAAPATRANELACLRSFYKWAAKFDRRADDPTRRLDPPRVRPAVPRAIGRADLERLLGEWTVGEPDLRRAYALGAYAGLRVSEAASLHWRDVDLEARRLYVTGKGAKERPVPLSAVLADYLLPDTGGNVVTGGGKPYSPAALQRKVNRHMRAHGVDHTFHDLRKRGASLALSKGASMAAVRMMFGWSSMQTVAAYAVVGDSELDLIAEWLT